MWAQLIQPRQPRETFTWPQFTSCTFVWSGRFGISPTVPACVLNILLSACQIWNNISWTHHLVSLKPKTFAWRGASWRKPIFIAALFIFSAHYWRRASPADWNVIVTGETRCAFEWNAGRNLFCCERLPGSEVNHVTARAILLPQKAIRFLGFAARSPINKNFIGWNLVHSCVTCLLPFKRMANRVKPTLQVECNLYKQVCGICGWAGSAVAAQKISIAMRARRPCPQIFSISTHFLLWEAVSPTKYCCSS